jgi:protein TonB
MQEQKRIDLQKRIEQKRVERRRVEQERKREEKAELRQERAEKLRKERAERARAAASVRARRAASRAAAPRAGASGRSIAAWQNVVQARVQAAAHSGSALGNGSATLVFTVEANGRVVSPHLAGSSGSAALDRTFLSIARRIGRLPPPPNGRVTVRVRVFH